MYSRSCYKLPFSVHEQLVKLFAPCEYIDVLALDFTHLFLMSCCNTKFLNKGSTSTFCLVDAYILVLSHILSIAIIYVPDTVLVSENPVWNKIDKILVFLALI